MNSTVILQRTDANTGRLSDPADYKWAVIFVLFIVFEGCFGKWVAESLEYPPVLLRDLIGIYIIYRAAISGRLRQHSALFGALSAWSLLVAVFAFVQALALNQSLILVAIGLRFWVLYLWIALALCSTLNWADSQRFCRLLILLFWWMLPLLMLQNQAGADAWINKSTKEDGFIFTIAGDVVRTTGTFSFTLGFTCFLSLVTPLLLAGGEIEGDGPKHWYMSTRWAIGGLILAAVVSGSRGMMGTTAVMVGLSVLISLAVGARGALGGLLGAVIGALLLLALPALLPETVSAIDERVYSAAAAEDVVSRTLHTVFGSPDAWAAFSILGEGLGMAANMAVRLAGAAPSGGFALAESETERVLLAGGLIGLLWLGLKITLAIVGIWAALKTAAMQRTVRPPLMWLCAIAALITWPVSGQLAAQSLGCLALALAAVSIGIFDRTRP